MLTNNHISAFPIELRQIHDSLSLLFSAQLRQFPLTPPHSRHTQQGPNIASTMWQAIICVSNSAPNISDLCVSVDSTYDIQELKKKNRTSFEIKCHKGTFIFSSPQFLMSNLFQVALKTNLWFKNNSWLEVCLCVCLYVCECVWKRESRLFSQSWYACIDESSQSGWGRAHGRLHFQGCIFTARSLRTHYSAP